MGLRAARLAFWLIDEAEWDSGAADDRAGDRRWTTDAAASTSSWWRAAAKRWRYLQARRQPLHKCNATTRMRPAWLVASRFARGAAPAEQAQSELTTAQVLHL